MGKEIRAGLMVIGTLSVIFVGLVLARLSRPPQGPPDVSISVESEGPSAVAPVEPGKVRLNPTIVHGPSWEEYQSPTRIDTTNPDPGRSPAISDNPRWPVGAALPSPDAAPLPREANTEYLPLPTSHGGDEAIRHSPPSTSAGERPVVVLGPDETWASLATKAYGDASAAVALARHLQTTGQMSELRPGNRIALPTKAWLQENYPADFHP